MKKFTLFFTLFSFILGTQLVSAQLTTVQDFESGGLGGPFGGAAGVLTANPDGNGQVAMLTSSPTGTVWQGININLTQNVRLTTDKSMSMRVYSTTPITIAPKVVGGVGGAPDSTTRAEHTGSGWETLTFSFNLALDGTPVANGDYSAFALHYNWNTAANTFGTPDSRVFYIDDLKGTAVAPPPPPAGPTVAAPTPPGRPSADVISIFSNAYPQSNISPINYDAGWCGSGAVQSIVVQGDDVFYYKNRPCQGMVFPGDVQDFTGLNRMHIDLFIAEGTNLDGKVFNLKTVAISGGDSEFNIDINALNPPTGEWFSYDVPVTYSGSTNNIHEFGVTSNLNDVVWYDNLYFHKNTLSTTSNELVQFSMYPNPANDVLNFNAKANIQNIEVYNIMGQKVLSNAFDNNQVSLNVSQLNGGVYIVKATIDGVESSAKFIKK